MSDFMLFAVLRMPYDMAMGDELSRRQFYARAQEAADRLDPALGAQPQAPQGAVTPGYKLVPIVPTAQMKAAGSSCIGHDFAHHCYSNMIAAAPETPEGQL